MKKIDLYEQGDTIFYYDSDENIIISGYISNLKFEDGSLFYKLRIEGFIDDFWVYDFEIDHTKEGLKNKLIKACEFKISTYDKELEELIILKKKQYLNSRKEKEKELLRLKKIK